MIEAEPVFDGLEASVATEGVTDGLDMESDRLLYDDGRTWLRRPAAAKSKGHRHVESRAATGLDARSHIWQEYYVGIRWNPEVPLDSNTRNGWSLYQTLKE